MGDHQRRPAVVCFSPLFFFDISAVLWFLWSCGDGNVGVLVVLGTSEIGKQMRLDPIDAERRQGGVTTTPGPRVVQHRMVHNTVYSSLKLRAKLSVSYTFPQYTVSHFITIVLSCNISSNSDRSALKPAFLPLRPRRLYRPKTPVFSCQQPIYRSKISQIYTVRRRVTLENP